MHSINIMCGYIMGIGWAKQGWCCQWVGSSAIRRFLLPGAVCDD